MDVLSEVHIRPSGGHLGVSKPWIMLGSVTTGCRQGLMLKYDVDNLTPLQLVWAPQPGPEA
jgi:hypothetical protein